MNLIDETFERLKREGKAAFIPFLTIGDPDLDTSVAILQELERRGAAIAELGVPYSDPLADGPVIQRASQRALEHRITIIDCMRAARQAREAGVRMPFILFTYYNPALQLGLSRYFELLAEHGISGTIIPDLPYEEDGEVRRLSEEFGIHLIPLVAPTSNDRVRMIASRARGFVYCVSSLGVTGERTQFDSSVDDFLGAVREATSVPIAVGFGISTNEQYRRFAGKADGVIVGSSIVRKVEEVLSRLTQKETRDQAIAEIGDHVAELTR